MKRINQLSNFIYISIIIFSSIILTGFLINYLTPVSINNLSKIEKTTKLTNNPIIYDTAADWSTVKQSELQVQTIERELNGHFIDTDTNGCFFLVMKMLNIDVDIDKYYLNYFNEIDQEIPHEGKISPDKLYQNSLLYLASNNINISVQDISNKSKDYLISVISNNYPVIIWYGKQNWTNSIPYIAYKLENNIVYMYNLNDSISLDINTFLNNYSGYAIVYGKYW